MPFLNYSYHFGRGSWLKTWETPSSNRDFYVVIIFVAPLKGPPVLSDGALPAPGDAVPTLLAVPHMGAVNLPRDAGSAD